MVTFWYEMPGCGARTYGAMTIPENDHLGS
jgi:hypothetical protein